MTKIAIIIPAYNEKENLEKLVSEINQNLNDVKIFIVDDSKTNESEHLFSDKENVFFYYRGAKLGRGSAVLFGLKQSLKENFDLFIEMDADFSHNPNELMSKIKFFNKNSIDLLVASRYKKNSVIKNWPLQRTILSKMSNFLARSLLGVPVTDYTNGFRFYSKRSVKIIITKCGKIGDGFIILSEILLRIFQMKYKIMEINTIFIDRKRGESSVSLSLIFNSLLGLFKLYINKNQFEKKL